MNIDLDQIISGDDWEIEIEFPVNSSNIIGNAVVERGIQLASNSGIPSETLVTEEAINTMSALYKGISSQVNTDAIELLLGDLENKIAQNTLADITDIPKKFETLRKFLYTHKQANSANSDSVISHDASLLDIKDYDAVQVVNFDEETRSFSLNKYILQQILSQPEVANNPVAIYSIAGKRRQGKSFLLNFFFSYLLQNRSYDWIDNIDLSNHVFEWKGGDEKCTKGIWLLNKPFVIKTPSHGEVSVFLMDTHGTFDPESDTTMNTFITTFSTLFSSYQIFNINNEVTEDYFQTLELFTGYGEKCQKLSQSAKSAKPFQNLMFLVRNWCLDPKMQGLNGGMKHLNKRLSINPGQPKEVQSNRKYIYDSFQKISCFLLRHPGEKVSTARSSSSLFVSDINPVFSNEVNELAVLLFGDPRQISVKMLNNKVLTGVEVFNLINCYWNVFENGKMPSVPNLIQAISETEILNEMRNLVKIYISEMEKMSQQSGQDVCYINEAKLTQHHSELKHKALNKLKSLSFAGSKDLAQKYCPELDHELEQSFQRFQQINELKKRKLRVRIDEEAKSSEKIYQDHLEETLGDHQMDVQNLQEWEKILTKKTLAYFDSTTKDWDSELVECRRNKLEEQLDLVFDNLLRKAKQNQNQFKLLMEKSTQESTQAYKNIMNQKCNGKVLENSDFQAAHNSGISEAEKKFLSLTERFVGLTDSYFSKIVENIQEAEEKYEDNNNKNKKRQKDKILSEVNKATNRYELLMNKDCSDYLDPDALLALHLQHQDSIMNTVRKDLGEETAFKFEDDFKQAIEVCFCNIKEKIKTIEKQQEHHFQQLADNLVENYKEEIQTTTYCDRLESLHEELKRKILSRFDSNEAEPLGTFNNARKSLLNEIEHAYQNAVRRNNQVKENEENLVSLTFEQAFTAYKMEMYEECESGSHVKSSKIRNLHQLQKDKLSTWFCENTNEMHHHKVEELHERMDEECERILIENKKKKESFRSKATPVVLGMGKGAAKGAAAGFVLTSFLPYPGAPLVGATVGGLIGGIKSLFSRK